MAAHIDHIDGPIAWREAGEGEPVIFLHGLGGTRIAWGSQLRGLADNFRCIAWDMPGYGDSELIEPLTYEAIADAVVRLMDQLDIVQADLVGLSFGGMHALHTALRHGDRVRRLVLADTSPAFGMNGTKAEDWIESRLAPLDAGATLASAAPAIVEAITAVPLEGQVRDETVGAFARIPHAGFRASVHCLPHNDVRSQLARITQPACVIVGELDEETPVAYAQVLADGLPNSTFHILEGVGHLSPAEAPDQFNEIVLEFLAGPDD